MAPGLRVAIGPDSVPAFQFDHIRPEHRVSVMQHGDDLTEWSLLLRAFGDSADVSPRLHLTSTNPSHERSPLL